MRHYLISATFGIYCDAKDMYPLLLLRALNEKHRELLPLAIRI